MPFIDDDLKFFIPLTVVNLSIISPCSIDGRFLARLTELPYLKLRMHIAVNLDAVSSLINLRHISLHYVSAVSTLGISHRLETATLSDYDLGLLYELSGLPNLRGMRLDLCRGEIPILHSDPFPSLTEVVMGSEHLSRNITQILARCLVLRKLTITFLESPSFLRLADLNPLIRNKGDQSFVSEAHKLVIPNLEILVLSVAGIAEMPKCSKLMKAFLCDKGLQDLRGLPRIRQLYFESAALDYGMMIEGHSLWDFLARECPGK